MFQHKVCNIEYDNALNTRLHERIFPSQELQPNFAPRPVPTKYTHFMTTAHSPQSSVELRNYQEFNTPNVFYSGNAKGPVQYALQQVDTESLLENRFMGLQKNDHAYYVPSIYSDLYQNKGSIPSKENKIDQYKLTPPIITNPNKCNLAPNTFHNSTRYNLKNLK